MVVPAVPVSEMMLTGSTADRLRTVSQAPDEVSRLIHEMDPTDCERYFGDKVQRDSTLDADASLCKVLVE